MPAGAVLGMSYFCRINENLPEAFPINEFKIVRDIIGIRPQRSGGIRLEKEILGGQKVIHAYGMECGYLFRMGVARRVVNIAFDFKMPVPVFAKLRRGTQFIGNSSHARTGDMKILIGGIVCDFKT
ncbi:hypothetical protein G7Y89_g8623 [Cudoniella acicularis]|uniref:Uncharacterized protein n=1 Tax=Cudoniella acicularis TaxID=354080 RepID=A0A8H4RID3_9HELO|nr:hypothetical protein G7Y89_g8623 [Cudoniella acicularis]